MTDPPARPSAPSDPGRSRALLAALAAVVFAIGALIGALATPSDTPPAPTPTPTAIASATPTPTATATATAAPSGDLQAAPAKPGEPVTQPAPDSDLRDESPPGVAPATIDAGKQAEQDAAKNLPPEELPIGGAQNYSCPDDFKGHVWSARAAGVRVMQFVLHYTVSANVPGNADVLGIRDYFARTRLGSAHDILDFEGHCIHEVPWDQKAWTEGFFNSASESVEIIATGKETRAQWLDAPIFRKGILAAIVRDRLRARGLPLRRVDPIGCTPLEGVTDHDALECGMVHTDVAPNFPWDVFMRQLTDAPAPTFDLQPLATGERRNAAELLKQRKIAQRNGGWAKVARSHLASANTAKASLLKSLAFLKPHRTEKKANRGVRYGLIRAIVAG